MNLAVNDLVAGLLVLFLAFGDSIMAWLRGLFG